MWRCVDFHVTSCLILVLCMVWRSLADESIWSNTLQDMLSRSCMYGYHISGFYSEYKRAKQDRRWRIRCSGINAPGPHQCKWTCKTLNIMDHSENIVGSFSIFAIEIWVPFPRNGKIWVPPTFQGLIESGYPPYIYVH